MKKKIILSSVVTIALCLTLIAGSTFALFTSSAEVTFVVNSGTVDVSATPGTLQLFSVKEVVGGTIVDEFGGTYEYEEKTSAFSNGGTATLTGNVLTIDRMTPGDKVVLPITMKNHSNVAAKYRVKIVPVDGASMELITLGAGDDTKGLKVYGGDTNTFKFDFEGDAIVGTFKLMAAGTEEGTEVENVAVVLEMPVTTGNEFQNKEASFKVVIEAVQANAASPDEIADING